MDLTEKQEHYVSHYIREIEEHIGDQLSQKQRERALARLRSRIDDKLKAFSGPSLEDADVLNMLHKMGQPETQSAILVRVWGDATDSSTVAATSATTASDQGAAPKAPATQAPSTGAPPHPRPTHPVTAHTKGAPVWLGVLLYTAHKTNLPLWALRILALLLGVATGPVALMLYMLAFVVLRVRGDIEFPAPFHPFRLVLHPFLTGAMLALFHIGGIYGIRGIRLAHQTYLDRPVPELNEWAWLEVEAGTMLLYTLVILMPLALFSAMPLANDWDYSLKRFTQAGVVLFAIAVSFGLASFLTGIILNFVTEFAG